MLSVKELKDLVRDFKKIHCPRLSAGKKALTEFVVKHKLIGKVPALVVKHNPASVVKHNPAPVVKPTAIAYVEPNWFKSVNDPEYFKIMTSKERVYTYKTIFGLGEQKFYLLMKPHLLKSYKAWCKREKAECPLLKPSGKTIADDLTREEVIDIIHKANCKMLKGLVLESMTKADIIKHLERVKCPELAKLNQRPVDLLL